MNKKKNIEKYQKFARNMEIVISVFFWACIATLVLSILAGIVLFFLPDTNSIFSKSNNMSFHLSLDNLLMFNLDTSNVTNGDIKRVLVRIMLMVSAIALVLTPILRQLVLILRSTKLNKPFSTENTKRLSIIGTSLIVGSLLIKTAQALVAIKMIESFKISNIDVNFGIDINMFLIGFLVLVLAGVFKHGSYLQDEYDTTI